MAHFNEGKVYEGIRIVKTFEVEGTRNNVKCCSHWEKRKKYVREIIYTSEREHLTTTVNPSIELSDELIA